MKYKYVILIACFIAGCISRQSKMPAEGIPVIDMEKAVASATDFYHLSDIAGRIEYIPLEFTPECPVGTVRRVYIASEDIFVLTSDNMFRFDKNGKFLNVIGKQGGGPGEYRMGFHLAVDTTEQHIYIKSVGKSDIVVYDYDGRHIQTRRIDSNPSISPFYILPETKNLVLLGQPAMLTSPESFFVSVTDIDNNRIFHKKYLLSSMLSSDQLAFAQFGSLQSADGLLLLDVMSDTIFNYRQSMLTPYLILNLGRYKAPLDAIISAANGNRNALDPYIYIINIVTETPQYLFLQFIQGEKWYLLRYDKHNQGYTTFKVKREEGRPVELIYNDIDGGLPVSFGAFPTYNQLARITHAFDMKEDLTADYFSKSDAKDPHAKERLKNLVHSLGDEDNPVIMKIILK